MKKIFGLFIAIVFSVAIHAQSCYSYYNNAPASILPAGYESQTSIQGTTVYDDIAWPPSSDINIDLNYANFYGGTLGYYYPQSNTFLFGLPSYIYRTPTVDVVSFWVIYTILDYNTRTVLYRYDQTNESRNVTGIGSGIGRIYFYEEISESYWPNNPISPYIECFNGDIGDACYFTVSGNIPNKIEIQCEVGFYDADRNPVGWSGGTNVIEF
jgi:hypothetical protein